METKVAQFIARYGLDGLDEAVVGDVTCGLHSGIPECCVLFYVSFWQVGKCNSPLRVWYRKAFRRLAGHPEYILCPGCLVAGTFVEVRPCSCEHRFARSRRERR